MSGDEPRRSVRSTKGVNTKNAESSPAPTPKPTKSKSKPPKKSLDAQPEPEEEDEDEKIRCVCGNDNPKDKRAFIGCDACGVWQHNVCMGVTDDSDDIPDHYFCEECRPEEHPEIMQSKENDAPGSYIWEKRNKIYQNEKKMSKSRKSKGRDDGKPGWLKKDLTGASTPQSAPAEPTPPPAKETGNKRKREDVSEEVKEEEAPEPKRAGRGDKRRKSAAQQSKAKPDAEHAIVSIDELPAERQKIVQALGKIIADDVQARVKAGHELEDGQTPKSVGDHHATLVEYALHMNHGGQDKYTLQFRALLANMKKNRMLIERLISKTLTADELATMDTKDMASEALQKERAALKAELDRQAVAVQEDGPKYRQTHKGPERIEDADERAQEQTFNAQPVRERTEGEGEGAGSPVVGQAQSPTMAAPPPIDTKGSPSATAGADRRTSGQQFDMNSVWAKAAGSPTSGGPTARPMQMPPRRRSSIVPKPEQEAGAKVDADVDRLLADNDDSYEPTEITNDSTIVWRGKLIQSTGDGEPTVNARFVAGRDLSVPWDQLLPARMNVDGRLQISKAEEYLCGLEWSNTSDVSVLALTPYDDADAFNTVFNYFHSRQRYAVVSKGLAALVKDLYIIPVEVGSTLPDHITKLEHCTIKTPIENRILLATFVVARSPDVPRNASVDSNNNQRSASTNGHHLPPHVQAGAPGPAGSPITGHTPSFSPAQGGQNNAAPTAGHGAPPNPFPPNPYGPQAGEQQMMQQMPPQQPPHPNPAVHDILGPLQMAPTAQQILAADPTMSVDKLRNLRRILEEDPATRTDIQALALKLGAA